eukprot:CAMPEP_0197745212 /NCGR_PEP_ID=MMETSP1435-20131217/41582_1 /TAXON_ID=426625 /ORGANISM="Chaetoceros brevis, Strain CCMP164" /LENGTH=296 /DNA_ID=CAMNT_0043336875 /DNA_START=188 /DNA_END=1075 /DNA_ORIENTATION=-
MPTTGSENVGVAFGAVIAAGASTAVGAAIVFFPRLVKLASRRVLASSLGISAGVMTYVSFVEIFQKAQFSFADHLVTDIEDEDKRFGMANLYATLSFFLGILTMVVIDKVINLISSKHGDGHGHGHQDISEGLNNKDNSNEMKDPMDGHGHGHQDISESVNKKDNCNEIECSHGHGEEEKEGVEEVVIPPCFTCNLDPAGDLKEWQEKAEAEEVRNMKMEGGSTQAGNGTSLVGASDNGSENVPAPIDEERVVELSGVPKVASMTDEEIENKKLVRMGIQTAVAIALHNFPEGLAT